MRVHGDPRRVLRFVEDHFDVLSQLYREQLRTDVIGGEVFHELVRHGGTTFLKRLLDYGIVKEASDDYRLSDEVAGFLGFLVQEFRPLLPEQLQRYRTSIEGLFDKLSRGKVADDRRIEHIRQLYTEVQQFLDQIANNTASLLSRTQRLKANHERLPYAERLREARLLIEEYIEPLNRIVDLRNANSLASLLADIGRRINRYRMEDHSARITEWYEQLDGLLRRVNEDLLREADIIRRELSPLLERIQRDSEVMNGWLTFLERPFRHPIPQIGARHRLRVFGRQTDADLRLFLERFSTRREIEPIVLDRAVPIIPLRPFQRRRYRELLLAALPLDDFFGWCEPLLEEVEVGGRERQLLKITSLLYEEDASLNLSYTSGRRQLRLPHCTYNVPVLSVYTSPA